MPTRQRRYGRERQPQSAVPLAARARQGLALFWQAGADFGLGTPTTAPDLVTTPTGLALNRAGAAFQISRTALGIPDSAPELTLFAIVDNGSIVSPGAAATIAGFSSNKDNTSLLVQNYTSGAQFYFYIYYAPSYNGATGVYSIPFKANASQGIVAVYKRNAYARVYVDGALAGEVSVADRDANIIGTSSYFDFFVGDGLSRTPFIKSTGVYLRALGDGEARVFSANPSRWLYGARRVPVPVSVAGGGDVSLALTGQGGSFSQGVFTLQRETPVAGQSATFSAGLLGASLTIPLTGVSGAFAPGSVVPSVAVALIGLSATAAQGSPAASITLALTGQAGTFATGTVTASTGDGATLVGQGGTFSQGTPGVSITVALTGITATLATGIVSAASGSATITLKAGSWLRYKKLI